MRNPVNTIMYLCYGEGRHVDEAAYSLLTAFRNTPPGGESVRYVVYTDKPERFQSLKVEIRVLTSEELRDWLGDSGYIHRRKTMSIIDALERFGGNVAFIDTDTFFRRPPEELFKRIGPGRSCLHVKEGGLLQSGVDVDEDMSNLMVAAPFYDRKGKAVDFHPNEDMWNSGVVGVNVADIDLMRDALFIIDEVMRRGAEFHHAEQFVTGHFLAANRASECRDIVFHYWPEYLKKPFRSKLSKVLSMGDDLPLQQRGRRLYKYRPQPPFQWWLKVRIRELGRRLGFNIPGPLKSA